MGRYLRWISCSCSTLLLAVVVLLAACGSSQSAAPAGSKAGTTGAASNGARIAVDEESFDFGKVPLDKVVSHSFRIKNVGNAPLVLSGEPPVRAVQGC